MDSASPHEWLAPRVAALVAEAAAHGIARDVCVAVINDLINGPDYNPGTVTADENWNQDIGEPDYMVNPDGTQSEGATGAENLDADLQHFPINEGFDGSGRI